MMKEEEEDSPLFKNFRTNPVVEEHSPGRVRPKAPIGVVNNTITSFAIISRRGYSDPSPILTSVTEKHGFWESEKVFGLACRNRDDINIAICKDSILLSRGNGMIVHKPKLKETWSTSMTYDNVISLPGIGFDISTGNYKVVRLLSGCCCQVLTINSTNHVFETLVKNNFTKQTFYVDKTSPIYTDGLISWLVHSPYHTYIKAVLCFDVATETSNLYRVAPQTIFGDDFEPSDYLYFRLVALEGRICLTTHNVGKARLDIWMVKETNYFDTRGNYFWVQEYSIDVGSIQYCNYEIIPVHVDRYRIFFRTLVAGLVCYDIRSQKFTTVYSGGVSSWFECVAYEEVFD